jgi:hypothetical protein
MLGRDALEILSLSKATETGCRFLDALSLSIVSIAVDLSELVGTLEEKRLLIAPELQGLS